MAIAVYPVNMYLLSIIMSEYNFPLPSFSPVALKSVYLSSLLHSRKEFCLVVFIITFTRKKRKRLIQLLLHPKITSVHIPEMQSHGLIIQHCLRVLFLLAPPDRPNRSCFTG